MRCVADRKEKRLFIHFLNVFQRVVLPIWMGFSLQLKTREPSMKKNPATGTIETTALLAQ